MQSGGTDERARVSEWKTECKIKLIFIGKTLAYCHFNAELEGQMKDKKVFSYFLNPFLLKNVLMNC